MLNDGRPDDVAYAARVLGSLTKTHAVVPGICGHIGLNIVADNLTAEHALGETLNLALRHKLYAYDAGYLEVALRSGLPLATLDAVLAKAAKKAGVPHFDAN